MTGDLPFDWVFLIVRLAFVGLLYLFLWQVMRVLMRDLRRATPKTSGKRKVRAKLIVVDPAESVIAAGTTFSVGATTTVGRHPDSAIVIDEPFVSSLHATIEARSNAWYMTDHDSTNGTFVNGRSVRGTVYIESQDVVQFGRIKLQFVA